MPRAVVDGRDLVADQILRETLLTVSSDWPFMVSKDSAAEYARYRAHLHAWRDAERELDSAVADLVQAPFDSRVQQTLANYLGSEQLQRATEAARRIGGQG